MLYEPHFLYDGYVYEVFKFGGRDLKEICLERAKTRNVFTEDELLNMYA